MILRPRIACALWTALFVFAAAGLFDRPLSGAVGAGPIATARAAAGPGPGDTLASEADRRYQAVRRAKRAQRLWLVAAAVYVPPLVLLVFGWAVAGIARRFRTARRH